MAMAATPSGAPLGLLAEELESVHERKTLCISRPPYPDLVLQQGENGFANEQTRFFSQAEASAADRLLELKEKLRTSKAEDFWTAATEGIGALLDSQYAYISKKMIVDDKDASIILPDTGDQDSCMLAMSVYYNGDATASFNAQRAKHLSYNSPCSHMKHNKVVLIPERLSEVVPNNPNTIPEQPEAFLAVPLAINRPGSGLKCVFGHIGVMWTANGLQRKKLSFAYLEMLLHSLEDIVVSQFEEQNLLDDLEPVSSPPTTITKIFEPAKVYSVFSAAASWKPYARSLSHELRTPMQGVVGMLDVMFAQVQEASEGQIDLKTREVFASLRESIEVVQDSARRAVEAADNVVHAYDMNMKVPEAPASHTAELDMDESLPAIEQSIKGLPTPMDSVSPTTRGHKRSRSSMEVYAGIPTKARRKSVRDNSAATSTPRREGEELPSVTRSESVSSHQGHIELHIAPGVRHTNVRQTLQDLVNDILKVGGRPTSAIAEPTDGGEEIEIHRKWANGEEKVQHIRWIVDPAVPESILVDERDFAGLIYRVLHNALKFTESGHIHIHIRLSTKGGYIVITIEDTGVGIPSGFMPNLFKPFSKEDDGITRQSEGLGLGLMVAKGLALRLKGDLFAVRSETDGPNRGTEFQIRIPLNPAETGSRPSTPFGSPSPSTRLRLADGSKSRSPVPLGMAVHRHSRSSSGASRLGLPPTTVTQGSSHTSIISTTTYQSEHISSVHMPPPHSFPPDIISPPISISADHHGQPSTFRVSPAVSPTIPKVKLAVKLPLAFLVVEDNTVLRKILVRMLVDMGYTRIHEAYDGADAVRQMAHHQQLRLSGERDYDIDVVLMDLWMPRLNGYQATEQILNLFTTKFRQSKTPQILAVTADVTDEATERVVSAGMKGPLTKPYKMRDLERNLVELAVNMAIY